MEARKLDRLVRVIHTGLLAGCFYVGAMLTLVHAGTPVPFLGGTSLFLLAAALLGSMVILAASKEDDHG